MRCPSCTIVLIGQNIQISLFLMKIVILILVGKHVAFSRPCLLCRIKFWSTNSRNLKNAFLKEIG